MALRESLDDMPRPRPAGRTSVSSFRPYPITHKNTQRSLMMCSTSACCRSEMEPSRLF